MDNAKDSMDSIHLENEVQTKLLCWSKKLKGCHTRIKRCNPKNDWREGRFGSAVQMSLKHDRFLIYLYNDFYQSVREKINAFACSSFNCNF